MRHLLSSIAIAGLALGHLTSAAFLRPVILADHNFDGRVDINDLSDNLPDKCSADGQPARFLPAITDTNRRCSKKLTQDTKSSQLDKCHDGSDHILRHPERLAPIRTLPIKGAAGGSITVKYSEGKKCQHKVRLFKKVQGKWVYHKLAKSNHFTGEELAAGLELGIDGRDVIRSSGWDGRVTIRFSVWDDKPENAVSDCVQMRVAPILTHHHLQDAEKVFVLGTSPELPFPPQDRSVEDIQKRAAEAGVKEPVYVFENFPSGDLLLDAWDRWVQDIMEPGYASIPGPDGPISIRVLIRSDQSDRYAGRWVFTELRDADVGAVQINGGGLVYDTLESLGNLETIPPYGHGDSDYPVGRTIMGAKDDDVPNMVAFLRAQEVQNPLVLDTSFLEVGHIDEMLQFLPADNERGWIIMAMDPLAALKLVRKAAADGHGHVPALSRPHLSYDPDDGSGCLPNDTVAELLAFENLERDNKIAATIIDQNLDLLQKEVGLQDEDIHRVPGMYWSGWWECPPDPGIPDEDDEEAAGRPVTKAKRKSRREYAGPETRALWPNTVNGLVLPNNVVLAPTPWGPKVDGVDILAEAAVKAYAAAGTNITFMDEYLSFHQGEGEVHCGTNSWREFGPAWWK